MNDNLELLMIPLPMKGHLVSSIQFAKQLLHHDHTHKLSVTLLIIPEPFSQSAFAIGDNGNNDDRIKYVHIPCVEGIFTPELLRSPPEKFATGYVDGHKPHVTDAVSTIVSSNVKLIGVVVDVICTSMIDVANESGVPSYIFSCSNAGYLGLLYHLFSTWSSHLIGSEESELIIPSFENPVSATSLPDVALKKEAFDTFMSHTKRFKETKGIFINTFSELESHAVRYLAQISGDKSVPPIYTVGPLLDLSSPVKKSNTSGDEDDNQGDEVMKWLDKQPPSSVVLLCFGSMGVFYDPTQIAQIALGLERSEHRFLWSVRKPAPIGKLELPCTYTNYNEILPSGFLERIGDRGMLCGWVSQAEVLAHNAIGGFVSHCGWNSILESVWFGVPIATWPMFAEQQLNAFQMVRDWGMAVEVKMEYRMGSTDVVVADDIQRAVTSLMDGDGGSEMRKKVKEMGEKGRKAMMEGGSSFLAFRTLIMAMLENIS